MLARTGFALLLLALFNISHACTNIMVTAKDKTVVVGRTLEFGPSLESEIVTSPKGKMFSNTTPDGQKSQSWQAKYGYVFLNFFGQDYTLDGLNEQGLSVGLLYLPGYTDYPTIVESELKNSIPYFQLGDWILSQFKSTEEVKTALATLKVFGQTLELKGKPYTFPIHFVVNDASGKSIVIEFNKGAMQVYQNPLGILTNSPTFDWQLNNLKNYANLTPYAVKPIKIDGFNYSSTGQGAGMVGLPGDTTPPSRFVKMSFLQKSAFEVDSAEEAVVLSDHIIGNVFIANGTVRDEKGTPGSETTQWTVFKDLKNGKLYFKSYQFPALQLVDLNALNLKEGAKIVRLPVSNAVPLATDVSQKLN
jgi:choloylglycine hydrolase